MNHYSLADTKQGYKLWMFTGFVNAFSNRLWLFYLIMRSLNLPQGSLFFSSYVDNEGNKTTSNIRSLLNLYDGFNNDSDQEKEVGLKS